MIDFYDKASEAEDQHREAALQNVIKRKKPEFTGFCIVCNDISLPGGRFCSPDCREQEELMSKIKRINGKI
jgi:predicted nucleic acid-binding Zn ribbon protein